MKRKKSDTETAMCTENITLLELFHCITIIETVVNKNNPRFAANLP